MNPSEPTSDEHDVPEALQLAENTRAAYLARDVLPSNVSIEDLKVGIAEKSQAMNEVTTAYLAVRDAHPEHEAQAATRVGFLHVNFACELLSATPSTSSDEELVTWRTSIERHARGVIEQGMHPLKTASELQVPPWSDEADRAIQLWYTANLPVVDFCRPVAEF